MSHRFKDVLLALSAAESESHALGRIQLQKLIYISDVLSPVWRYFSNPASFIPYKRGPYDSSIQNTVDTLVFRNLVTVDALTIHGTRQIESQYRLNHAGSRAVGELTKEKPFADDLALYLVIVNEVQYRQWSNIKSLVYAEPTYESAKANGKGGRLRLDQSTQNLSLAVLNQFKKSSSSRSRVIPNRKHLVQIYFTFLDAYKALPQAAFSG